MFRRLLIALVLVALFLPAIAMADQIISETIATFTVDSNNFIVTNNTTSETFSVTLDTQMQFEYGVGIANPFGTSTRNATFYLNLTTTTPAGSLGSYLLEGGLSGTFTITDNLTSTNLLSGTLSAGSLSGFENTANFGFGDSAPNVTFSSHYVSFGNAINEAVQFSMASLSPSLNTGAGGFLLSSTSGGTGIFSDQIVVPEPMTLLLSGGALIAMGFLLRKRNTRRAP
jgi:hypothetical protein